MEKWASFFDRVLDGIRDIPIQDVIGQEIKLVHRGRYWMGLCPFHPDTKLGSFIITPSIGMWKCFACGHQGDSIGFIMQYKGMNFVDACLYIAAHHGIIAEKEYQKYSKSDMGFVKIKPVEKKATQEDFRADADVMNYVYNTLPKVFPLTEKHRQHLLTVRGLNPDRLNDYFSFNQHESNVEKKILQYIRLQILKEANFSKEEYNLLRQNNDIRAALLKKKFLRIKQQLAFVPGFFRNSKGELLYMANDGIGFLIRDEKGFVSGIQMRRDKGEPRYVWFSSAFAIDSSHFTGGASSGSPGGIILSGNPRASLCITEGRFKAEKIANLGNDAIYVSGVSTWKSVMPIVKNTIGDRKRVCIMFDSDMLGNAAVHGQLKSLATAIQKENLKPVLIIWSKKYGKGFDDLVLAKGASYARYLKMVDFEEFEKKYQDILKTSLAKFGVTAFSKLDKAKADEFKDVLQEDVENAFLKKLS